MKKKKLHCNQCGEDWESRKYQRTGELPVQCPRCKRVDYREPKKGSGAI